MTISARAAPSRRGTASLSLTVPRREMWTSLAIKAIWPSVLFAAIFGPTS